MDWLLALLAAIAGYLIGSISFARVITRLVAPKKDISKTELDVKWTEDKFHVDTISATTVSMAVGRKFGFLTFVLDTLKVTVPTLVFKQIYPASPYFLIAATAGLLGHNWPVYHRFQGGRGFSALYGGMLIIDWPGIFITTIGGIALSAALFRNLLLTFSVGLWLFIPWLWFRTHQLSHLAYGLAVNIIVTISTLPELRLYEQLRKEGKLGDVSEMMKRYTGMWAMMAKLSDRLGLMPKKLGE
jgi:glycerol-3-phosphate acyltransferase PlsY